MQCKNEIVVEGEKMDFEAIEHINEKILSCNYYRQVSVCKDLTNVEKYLYTI